MPFSPATPCISSAAALCVTGLATAAVSNVILEAVDSFPNHAIDLATLLRPPHIAGSSTAVNLTNVVLLHIVSAAQAAVAVATLRGVVSDPIVQRGVADWSLHLYTVSGRGHDRTRQQHEQQRPCQHTSAA
jgi:hypothetical protein